MKHYFFAVILLAAAPAHAGLIVIEPSGTAPAVHEQETTDPSGNVIVSGPVIDNYDPGRRREYANYWRTRSEHPQIAKRKTADCIER